MYVKRKMHVLLPTLKNDPPGRKEGFKEGHTGELPALPHVGVEAGQHRLDGQVGKAVGSGGKDVGDAGVHVRVVAGVASQEAPHGIVTHNVLQVVPEDKHLQRDGCGQRRRSPHWPWSSTCSLPAQPHFIGSRVPVCRHP